MISNSSNRFQQEWIDICFYTLHNIINVHVYLWQSCSWLLLNRYMCSYMYTSVHIDYMYVPHPLTDLDHVYMYAMYIKCITVMDTVVEKMLL